MKKIIYGLIFCLIPNTYSQVDEPKYFYIERIVFFDENIISNKALISHCYEKGDTYLPLNQVSEELDNTLDSLINIRSNNWEITGKKHVVYKVRLNENLCLVASDKPIKAIDKYFLWAVMGHDYEIDSTFNDSWF